MNIGLKVDSGNSKVKKKKKKKKKKKRKKNYQIVTKLFMELLNKH